MRPKSPFTLLAAAALLAGAGAFAQIEGGRGVAPIDSAGNYEVSGVSVDVAAKTADAARLGGWRLAQRKAWVQLSQRLGAGGGLVSDGTLDQLVSGIVIENEQIGPTRYIAKLGVLFNRARAASLLGVSAYADRSRPMLVVPLMVSGGVETVFEQPSAWQAAWARFRTGNSAIDYVRPSGSGADSLLLNAGQISRPGRGWWRTILDQYGASDVLIPVVRLYRSYPGGPIIGVFQARHGPDNDLIGSFTLRVGSAAGLPQLLDTGVARMDGVYQQALRSGALHPDSSLSPPPAPEPVVAPGDDSASGETLAEIVGDTAPASAGIPIVVQADTPGASSVANIEGLLRGIPGVRAATTTSLALGGVSLLRVTYDGDPATLRAALEVRGYQVSGTGQTLRIRRAPQLQLPNLPPDTQPAG
ncbi:MULTISPECIES: heavy metal-associated domain-containing protein [unclassified Sphingomonas]|uniref:heavy-metal-associated domain-containing protein n=2 Tax=Pseudomonadota TaxID=1224 RepID=UPI000E103D62|nr:MULTISPECIES: heavy metal-associated domain-containing protein [unclassified Sphingomonas]AXJ97137.1 heavy-metal-associated domain-containing protein [Sphingomonas sp. FARSPH]